MVMKCFRPDRLTIAMREFTKSVLKTSSQGSLNLASIVTNDTETIEPVLFCATRGYDASSHIEKFASQEHKELISVALGSPESIIQATNAIMTAHKKCCWLILKNVHLVSYWIPQLEKKLQSLKAVNGFKVFITLEMKDDIPTNLILMSRVLIFEPPSGVKSNLSQLLPSLRQYQTADTPAEFSRLAVIICWLHAVIQERLYYKPFGWTKAFEFNDADFHSSLQVVKTWLTQCAQGRSNILPSKIPWKAIKQLLKETIYGGKVDNEVDYMTLEALIDKYLHPSVFERGFELVSEKDNHPAITLPDTVGKDVYEKWLASLPSSQSPHWLGIPDESERIIMSHTGKSLSS